MKIKMIKKFIKDGENINFIFNVDDKKIQIEIGGTALGMLGCTKDKKVKTQNEILEEVVNNFDVVNFIEAICSRLNFLNFGDEIKIVICSSGAKVDIISLEECKKFVKI